MDNGEADELGRFRRFLASAQLAELAIVMAGSLDACIDLIRKLGASNVGVEMAAALSAELHKRNAPPTVRAPMGNA
jgi:hypothetical protein